MPLTILYTTADSVRSTIGLDEDDIPDTVIGAQNLDLQMLERLESILPTYEAIYDGSDAGQRRLTLWCQYFGALQLLDNSSLGIPQKIQANTDQMSRFNVDFEKLKGSLRAKLVDLENKLNPVASVTQFSLLGISTAGYDPVAGA